MWCHITGSVLLTYLSSSWSLSKHPSSFHPIYRFQGDDTCRVMRHLLPGKAWKISILTDNSSQNEINMPTHNAYHCIFSQKAKRRKSVLRSKRSHTNSPSSQVSLWKNWWKRYFQSLFTLKQSNILCIFSFSSLRKKLCPLGSFLITHERGIYLGQDEVVWKETGWPFLLMTQLCH